MPTDIKRLVHLNHQGKLQRVVGSDTVELGSIVSSSSNFTINGKGVLFDDGSSSSGAGGVSSLNLQNVYNNQSINPVILNTGQNLVINSHDQLHSFTINATTGDVTITGLLNGIDFNGLALNVSTHTTFSASPKHMASEIGITPITINPTATNVQEVLDQLHNEIVTVSGNAGNGLEYVQTLPALIWVIPHNKNTKKIQWTLWDELDEWVMPDKVKLVDNNTMHVYFGSPQAGRMVLMTF